MILFSALIEDIVVIPYVRMTRKSTWTPRAQRYLKSQQDLATMFKQHYKKKEPISEPCILSYSVHLPHKRRVDDDNIRKALQDALQYAGIVEDDRWIKGSDKARTWQDGRSRVAVTLKRLGEEVCDCGC